MDAKTDDPVPTVSVALIVYNQESLIEQTIESVLVQETSFDVELVIGDDHSTDRTRDIITGFARRFPAHIRLGLQDRNRGLMTNFMDTFRACRGKYIALLDGDDYWTTPDKLERQVRFLDEHPGCSVCFHNASVLLDDGTFWEFDYTSSEQRPMAGIEDLLEINPFATSSAMVRRAALPSFPPWYATLPWEDWPLYLLLAERGAIAYLPDVMGIYRRSGTGLWSRLSPRAQVEAKIDFLLRVDKYLEYRYSPRIRESVARYREGLGALDMGRPGTSGPVDACG